MKIWKKHPQKKDIFGKLQKFSVQWNLDLRKPNLWKNLDLRKIVATTEFLVHKLFDLRKIFWGLMFDLRKIFPKKWKNRDFWAILEQFLGFFNSLFVTSSEFHFGT